MRSYVVLAPEHPLLDAAHAGCVVTAEQRGAVDEYLAAARAKSEFDRGLAKDKTGVPTGARATHPLTGEPVPVWVADYVIGGYGTGAVMAVPAHDERDFEFAAAFDLPVVRVVRPAKAAGWSDADAAAPLEAAFTAPGVACGSGEGIDGLATADAKLAVIARLERDGRGCSKVTYKLRDWLFSRQRYWGEPIPIYFPVELGPDGGDPRAGAPHTINFDEPIAVDDAELPLRLPPMDDFAPGDDPAGCLARAVEWRYFERDGRWFARETNTMPQWAGSCWYYLRFADNRNAEAAISPAADAAWLPVDLYAPRALSALTPRAREKRADSLRGRAPPLLLSLARARAPSLSLSATSAARSTRCSTCCTRGSGTSCCTRLG